MRYLAAAAILVATSTAQADVYGLSVGGYGGGTRGTLSRHFEPRTWLRPELAISMWRGPNGSAIQLTAVPMLRYDLSARWFIEGGIGVSYFTRTDFGRSNITTRFQFADQLGIGYELSSQNSIGLRLSHFSNAGIKEPNPGAEVVEVTYRVRF